MVRLQRRSSPSSSRHHRNIKEKDRRMRMKDLLSTLARNMPCVPSKLSVTELIDHATVYVKQLQETVEEKKQIIIALSQGNQSNMTNDSTIEPKINITDTGSTLEVSLITGSNKNFMIYEIIEALQEEGADVISVSYNNIGDKIIYHIKSQAFSPRIGVETLRVQEKINDLAL